MFAALKRGFRTMASLILVVGVLQPKRILAASRGFLAAARLSCYLLLSIVLLLSLICTCFLLCLIV